MEKKKENKKIRVGVVVSDKMDKTRVVAVDRVVLHPVFKKYYKRTKNYKIHDPQNTSKTGDQVEIIESRPLSKTKRWRLKGVLRKAAA
ncbi:MAG: 30S ribosomal protein S17 [Deltaproteobacteria bacterium]|nr:30S ribosomal protein S17 [Deltaproteobacteria bacterium]